MGKRDGSGMKTDDKVVSYGRGDWTIAGLEAR